MKEHENYFMTHNNYPVLISIRGVGMYIRLLLMAFLLVCSTKGFLELFRNLPVATVKSLSLIYGKPPGLSPKFHVIV